nr:putative mitochondrial protein [Tanacetum cinerariifolium]
MGTSTDGGRKKITGMMGEDNNSWGDYEGFEGSKRIRLVTNDGTMKDKNGAQNTTRTGFGQLRGVSEEVMEGTFIKGLKLDLTGGGSIQTTIKREHFRRVTEFELEERKAKGLCFRCEEKYKPSHRCALHTLYVMTVDDRKAENEPYFQVKPWDHALKASPTFRGPNTRSGGVWSGGLDLKKGANCDQHSRDQRASSGGLWSGGLDQKRRVPTVTNITMTNEVVGSSKRGNQDKVYNGLLAAKNAKHGEESKVVALNDLIAKALDDIDTLETDVEILDGDVNSV